MTYEFKTSFVGVELRKIHLTQFTYESHVNVMKQAYLKTVT